MTATSKNDVTKELAKLKKLNESLVNDFAQVKKENENLSRQMFEVGEFIGMPSDMALIFKEILRERIAQDKKWGVQNHPDGTGPEFKFLADAARAACEKAHVDKRMTWKYILTEEFMEAMAEAEAGKLTTELVQTLAVGVAWIQAIWRRKDDGAIKKAEGQVEAH